MADEIFKFYKSKIKKWVWVIQYNTDGWMGDVKGEVYMYVSETLKKKILRMVLMWLVVLVVISTHDYTN